MKANAYVEITSPCIFLSNLKDTKIIYSQPGCFDITQLTIGYSTPGKMNNAFQPYFLKIYDIGCFQNVTGNYFNLDEIENLQNIRLPDGETNMYFTVSELTYSSFPFFSGSINIPKKIKSHPNYILTNIQSSYTGNLRNCTDLEVNIPIISDEAHLGIGNSEKNIQIPSSIYFHKESAILGGMGVFLMLCFYIFLRKYFLELWKRVLKKK